MFCEANVTNAKVRLISLIEHFKMVSFEMPVSKNSADFQTVMYNEHLLLLGLLMISRDGSRISERGLSPTVNL